MMSDEDELNLLIEAIKNGETETSLYLNNIGDEGATALANALANNASLQTLSLSYNIIGDEGATALANALASNESLQTLK
ncbi:Hypothetical Protein FCC1311_114852 [Hondaea fermentalgiana]|uniref:Nucleotide-binding oligomerization domain-containing protein 1 n=1 Tax=Hondaea fermentalgiana TaxID=2315210 RepID=A0A2R5GWQ4_9STRA|nr:Hypothetical Protein FCC1311_114852 [Hondaea fermentalgiana]|eukprot:GBG35262.1 Hypothetical Protein FCC1311_114852 [Hondaea fermentalgiana]